MFDQPPIVCHHDFAKSTLPCEELPANVSLVLPALPTGWGIFSTVEAAIRAIQLMYKAPAPPDWFVLLSESDYPIKPAKQIRRELGACPYDANIHHELIDPSNFQREWHYQCYERYYKSTLLQRTLVRHLPRLHPLASRRPFSARFRCYAGEFWFCATGRAAEYILQFYATRSALASHYRSVQVPEESYFQCVLANATQLKLNQSNYRYTDWSDGGPHPKTLGMRDLPRLLSSPAHFARKFDADWDARILDELDALTEG
jgi:hypothetical protein